jgi:F-type H+-transporting ATPase subunit delta|tara:strand:- start:1988 stop:2554 length:567 start_codon:yes stop_codon:yes gene_type:complete
VDVSEPASISAGIAARYASAIFELAKEDNVISALENDLDALEAALADSAEFRDLISSPVYTRDELGASVAALGKAMGLTGTMTNALGLMAGKRRLFALPQLAAQLRDMIAEEKGEVTAEVVAAKAMTKAQQEKLAAVLKKTVGKTVNINASVDESLIGGLIVKVGSKMVDTSIRSKLAALQNTMKEVG